MQLSLILTTALLTASQPTAEPNSCDAAQPLEGTRLLRRISLDVRGHSPTYTELLEQQSRGAEVPDTLVDDYLAGDGFLDVLRDYHAQLLWPNIEQIDITPQANQLLAGFVDYDTGPAPVFAEIWWSPLRGVFQRAILGDIFVPCRNEPAQFDTDGNLIATPTLDPMTGDILNYREGYVEVEPFWAPGTTVRVCGFDAQANLTGAFCDLTSDRYPFLAPFCEGLEYATYLPPGLATVGDPNSCAGPFAYLSSTCGCGPAMIFCNTPATEAIIRNSLIEQQSRIVDHVVSSDRRYFDILESPYIEVNGPIAHYLRFQAATNLDLFGDRDPTLPLPDGLGWASGVDSWEPVNRWGRHAGLLSTPGFLMRFPTNRGRAHRYYNAFECSSFIPNGPLPPPSDPCSQHEDLTQRCGCDACHTSLEPMAAHWGRFAEYGFSSLDEDRFPEDFGASCLPPFADLAQFYRCTRFYELDPVGEEAAFENKLLPYVFRTDAEKLNIEQGPTRLVRDGMRSGQLASCTAQRMWGYLMRREPTASEQALVLPELIEQFQDTDYDIKTLAKAIVTHPAYRRQP